MVLTMKVKEWTRDEIELLRLLYPSEAEFSEVAAELSGRSPNSIRLMASRLGLKRPNPLGNVRLINSIALSEGNLMRGVLVRCGECGAWIHVDHISVNSSVTCERCGAVCVLTA